VSQDISSRERVLTSLSHRQPDRVPTDFGGTPVTGIHVSCVAGLGDYFGLQKRLVRVHEPYQMLGMLDEDLKQAMGIDGKGVYRPRTSFGFRNRDWKICHMPAGLEVGVQGVPRRPRYEWRHFDPSARRLKRPPSERMPKDGYFFDAIIGQPNPVQCSAAGMDPEHLKNTYGERITFWAGGVDIQHVLPLGTLEEVRKQVLDRCQ
jgi:hypothetical protein